MALRNFKNYEIVKILREMAEFFEAEEIQFKPRAYERVVLAIEIMEEQVFNLYKVGGEEALRKIPGVGQGIAGKITELFKTGKIKEYEKLKKKYPVNMDELTAIEGVGPKTVLKLYKKIKTKNLKSLERAARTGKIKNLEGFGKKSEDKILEGIEFLKSSSGRMILGNILPTVKEIETNLKSLKTVRRLTVCGSIRRMQETIGDIDILVVSERPKEVVDFFVSMKEVAKVYSSGKTKTMIRLKIGIDADLRVVKPESYGAAIQYFTGSKSHNVALREIAIKKGYKLNEYGLFSTQGTAPAGGQGPASGGKGKKSVAGRTEEEIYKKLGLEWMPPELRTNSGEIEATKKRKLPKVISYGALKGDLQCHSNWTDGSNTILEMAKAAEKQGLDYIVITDHTKSLAMTGGLNERDFIKQWKEIDKVNKSLGGKFKVLKGAEVNIMKDGKLDIDDKTLSKLDVVGGAVHSNFNLDRKIQTERIKKAMNNKNVDIIFHPTGRILQKRDAYQVDVDDLIREAKKTKTILEIDSYPNRLDLKDEYIRTCVKVGVKLSIDSDGHNVTHFEHLELGVGQARRGWATSRDIINTRSWSEMKKLLK
jgi:DNA polymerase (family 10)